ncbi:MULTISPECIES: adenylate kinase [Polymorphospora]|uniref:Adenylate kinase n=1 Tax=Polymorphospora lycopeni TaxID=3140240 RepID=A0ABV5CTM9_9ACTN
MRRILVVGSGGAGKSTLARQLGERLELPVVHLDRHYWQPGWVATEPDRWRATVGRLAAADAWVMDGNYGSTLDLRLPRADLLVLCDLPRPVCLWAVIRRRWRFRATGRPDLHPGCPERLTPAFLRWIWSYPGRPRTHLLAAVAAHTPRLAVVRLRSRREVRRWLAGGMAYGRPPG